MKWLRFVAYLLLISVAGAVVCWSLDIPKGWRPFAFLFGLNTLIYFFPKWMQWPKEEL